MGKDKSVMERLAASTDLEDEPLPGLPLVEIAGDKRVLIENHLGVSEYAEHLVGIRVKLGKIMVFGNCLRLSRMTKGQLIISGCIDCVKIVRRNG